MAWTGWVLNGNNKRASGFRSSLFHTMVVTVPLNVVHVGRRLPARSLPRVRPN